MQHAGEHLGLYLSGNGFRYLSGDLLLHRFRDGGADGVLLCADGGGDLFAGHLFGLRDDAFRVKGSNHAVQRVGVVADGQCGDGDTGSFQALIGLKLGVGGVQQCVEHGLGTGI